MQTNASRRQFLGTTLALAAGLGGNKLFGMPAIVTKTPRSLINGVQIGCITYSFRDMPDQSADATLQYVLEAGISAIELMGGPAESFAGAPKNTVDMRTMFMLMRKRRDKTELSDDENKTLSEIEAQMQAYREEMGKWRLSAPMDKFEQLRKTYKKAGVEIYGFKPDAFGRQNTDADINYGLSAAKALGASQVTLEHPSNDAHTLKLGKMAEKYSIRIGYHGHEQQTPTFWDTALAQSPANALNFDIGHYVAAGNPSPIELLQAKHNRIASMHIKDRQTKANGGGNLEWGKGNTPLAEALKLMSANKYKFPAAVELEYKIPEGSNAVSEVKKCVEFCKNILG